MKSRSRCSTEKDPSFFTGKKEKNKADFCDFVRSDIFPILDSSNVATCTFSPEISALCLQPPAKTDHLLGSR